MLNSDRVAVVTGANRGLGLETCRQLAQQGIKLVLTSRSVDKGRAAAEQLQNAGLDVRFHALDVTDAASVRALADFIESDMNGCCPAYRLSKTALNAITRIFADELKDTKIKINSVCPGSVRTDMGGSNAERSLVEGAAGIVWAACLPEDGPSGGFFRDGQPILW